MELSKPQDLINQGAGIYSTGDYAGARAYFEKAVAEDPMCAKAYVYIGQTYVMEDNYDKARESLKNAILINKKEAAAYFHLGNVEMLDGNRDIARENYAKALNYGFDSMEIYRNLAADAEEMGHYSEALNYYDKIIAKDKMNAYAKIRRTHVFIVQGKYAEALKASESLMETSPDLLIAHQLKFAILSDLARYEEAEKVLDRAEEMFPESDEFVFDRATLYGVKGEHAKAIELLDKIELTENNEVTIVIKKAQMLLADLKTDEAVALLEPLYAKTFDSEAAYLLCTVLMAKKDYEKAKRYAQELVDKEEYDDFYYSGLYMRAVSLLRTGDKGATAALKEANKLFRAACARNPGYVQYYLYRAVCHKELGELNDALEMLDYIVTVAPELAEGYYLRSQVYTELGQTEKAAEDRTRAIELKPDIAELLETE